MDAIALPFVQGQLTGRDLVGAIETACAHCSQPMRIEISSRLGYRVTTPDADPVISMPLVNFKRLKDPSIIHAF